ncbi:MAG TPA: polyprenyl synthetase family protein [Kofleriaceae bacterium]
MRIEDAYLVRSTLADVASSRCETVVLGDSNAPAALRGRLDRRHALVRRALDEVLAAGHLPYPDAIADTADVIRDLGKHIELRLMFPSFRCDLAIAPANQLIVGKTSRWTPHCSVTGTIVENGVAHAALGTATLLDDDQADVDRAIIQLDDTEIHVWRDGERLSALVSSNASQKYDDVTLTPLSKWTSIYTFHDFGDVWHLRIPSAQIELELRATFSDQELVTMTTTEPRWQGRCDVEGAMAGRFVKGVAYLEHAALDVTASMSELFAAVPRETLRALHKELPLPLTSENVRGLVGPNFERYLRDVDLAEVQRVVVEPIREILDRKGKAWRSYAAVMCYYATRGERQRDVVDLLLALAEIIHVGSLIVDDVQDASPTRRGGPSTHAAHGVPLAINAGNFCYFVWQAWLERLELSPTAKLRIYELYFELMRVAHLGQALDIQGFTPAMADEIIASGNVDLLARQLMNVYVLKTGAPASVFAQMGAIVAGGSDAQQRAIADLFEALGNSFQIMDDVQNLKGFIGDPKHCEDLIGAKVTMPLLEALRVLDLPRRRDLWDRIKRCAEEPSLVPAIVETIDQSGAFTACRDHAQKTLEAAWQAAAPVLEDSIAKIMLRSFCFYVVESLG